MNVRIVESKEVAIKIEIENEHQIDRGKLGEELAKRLGRKKPYTRARISRLLVHGDVKSEDIIRVLREIPMEVVKYERSKRK